MERRDKIVEGKTYSILMPPVRQAMPICTRLAVLLGPILGTLGSAGEGKGLEKFSAALQAVDPDKVDKLIMDAVRAAHLCCNNAPISGDIDFDKHFNDNRQDVYTVTTWALWEVVKDFFPKSDVLTLIMGKAKEAALQSLKDGQTTTG